MAAKKRVTKTKQRPVIVTTPTRDVWYGLTDDSAARPLVLHGARHCYYWDTREGLGQLASTGPGPLAKIGARVTRGEIAAVATVLDCTPEAAAALERATWAR